jgi:hypothetical protein
MVKLENLKWSPKWVSHLGCVKGCLEYLGIEISDAWLYGGTGHAFIINIGEDNCPSGPTAWNTIMLNQGGVNLGYEIDGIFGWKGDNSSFSKLQAEAWDFTRSNIDKGYPVYGWELAVPEFYVVNGYDEIGYYFSGPGADDGAGPKPWGELGDTGIGMIEVYRIKPGTPKPDAIVVKSAIESVLKHASNTDDWIQPNYGSGLKGFDNWVKGLESGVAGRFGMGYNAAVWYECRRYAVAFLKEAKERLDGDASDLFGKAIEHYQIVADSLGKVSESYPFMPSGGPDVIPVDDKSMQVVEWLKEAKESEAAGLKTLEKIQAEL